MENKIILKKLQAIFRNIMNNKNLTINSDMSAKDIQNWDSLNNIKLILNVEKEFEIRFNSSEISNLETIKDLIESIDSHTSK